MPVQAVGWTLGGLVLLLSLWTAARLAYTQLRYNHSKRRGPTFVSHRTVRPYSKAAYALLDREHEALRAEYETLCDKLMRLGEQDINLVEGPAGPGDVSRLPEMERASPSLQSPAVAV